MEGNVFGQRLRELREAAGLSARAAATSAGFSEALWRQYEKGERQVTKDITVPVTPTAKNVRAAAAVVEWDLADALEAAGLSKEAAAERAARRTPALSVVPTTVETQPAVEEDNEVLAAIRRDPNLSPRNKAHFLNQYELLRDLSALEGARVTAPEEPLPYVAHGQRTTPVDPEEEKKLEDIAREARRRNHDGDDDEQVPPR